MGHTIHTFMVTGMHCASCTMLIDETLEDLPGVHRSETILKARQTTVHTDPAVTAEAIIAGIKDAGYNAALQEQL